MENEQIKDAFQKVKNDIIYLNNEIKSISIELQELKEMIKNLHQEMNNQKLYDIAKTPVYLIQQTDNQTIRQTDQQVNPTDIDIPTHNPTVPQETKGLKNQNMPFSTGNEGVPTDRQTNQQTDIPSINSYKERDFIINEPNIETNIKEAKNILDSLDRLKKEIRQKFKRLTSQEMAVFSIIYQLEESDPLNNTYKEIAKKLKLSESSIRDYTLRIISKGIPLKKNKINNKKIILSVSQELKNIASLSTILQLRDL